MPMRDESEMIPDTYGLPVYRPTKWIKERVGNEIRMLCGVEAFGKVTWTHITILDVSDMVLMAGQADTMNFKDMKRTTDH